MLCRAYPFGLALILASAAAPHMSGATVIYTLTGYVQGSGGGTQVNTSFIWTATADSSAIVTTSPGQLQVAASSSVIIFKDVGTAGIPGVTVYLNTTAGQVTLGNIAKGAIGLTAAQLKTWDLVSPMGPLNGTNFLVGGSIATDDGTVIAVTGVANLSNGPSPTFQAAQPPPTISNVVNSASGIVPGRRMRASRKGPFFW